MVAMETNEDIWKPEVTVAAVIEHDGRFLLIEEATADGAKLNQPAGHLEPGETLTAAVVRETLEESAHHFLPESLLGVYHHQAHDGVTYMRFAFGGRATGHDTGRALDHGILRHLWMNVDELRASRTRHRSPLVLQCVEDFLAGIRYPLEIVRHYAPQS
jgi:ADP-ribose pyrophosphatase YjhB (NUDIX family)